MDRIAVVGAGLIGRAWAIVFARAGLPVLLWDKFAGVADGAVARIGESLADLEAAGLLTESPATIAARIGVAPTLEACVADAGHVQENGPERLQPKRELFAELDRLCPPEVVLERLAATPPPPRARIPRRLAARIGAASRAMAEWWAAR